MDVYNGDYINAVAEIQGWPEEFLRKNIETTEAQREVFSKAFSAGVPIIYGTDSAVYPHGDNAKQFVIMVRQGMTPGTNVECKLQGQAGIYRIQLQLESGRLIERVVVLVP